VFEGGREAAWPTGPEKWSFPAPVFRKSIRKRTIWRDISLALTNGRPGKEAVRDG
jgi:hypothetical protein